MKTPISRWRLLVWAAASLAVSSAIAAEHARAPRQLPAEPADEARVIVRYKPQAPILRQQPLSMGTGRTEVNEVLHRRAQALVPSARVPLQAGRALGLHTQVLRARGLSSAELARRLSADPEIEYAVVDGRKRALLVPNDPLYAAGPPVSVALRSGGPASGQWYLRAPAGEVRSSINATAAWDVALGAGSGVVVAVLDTGIVFDHIDLQGRLLPGYDFISDVSTANDGDARDAEANDAGDWITSAENTTGPFRNCGVEDSSWHGTRIAGIIGAATNNGIGMAGIAFGSLIRPVRVLGKCGGVDSDIIAGLLWAAGIDQPGLPGANPRARVLNMSLGSDGACSAAYRDAVAQVNAAGAVVVAAAGNSAGRAVGTPANCSGMIAVAALRHAGSKVGFSDLGPEISIAAPGGNCVDVTPGSACQYPIISTTNSGTQKALAGGSIYNDAFNYSVGTSFATPIVAGVAALVLSAQPGLTPTEVKQVLQSTARPFPTSGSDNGPGDPTPVVTCQPPGNTDQFQCYCTTAVCGAGMVDALAAAQLALQGIYARIGVSPANPEANAVIQLNSASTLLGTGRTAVAWTWQLISSGGIVSGFSGAANAATASLLPTAAGLITVRLTVLDDIGRSSSADTTITVAAASNPPAGGGSNGGSGGSSGSGGGGLAHPTWLVALLATAVALRRAGSTCKPRQAGTAWKPEDVRDHR